MANGKIKFLQKPSCTTCRKAKDYLEKLGAELELRSLDADPLSEDELDTLIGSIRPHGRKLSSSWPKYRILSGGQWWFAAKKSSSATTKRLSKSW